MATTDLGTIRGIGPRRISRIRAAVAAYERGDATSVQLRAGREGRAMTTAGVSIAHHQALADRDAARLAELAPLGKRTRDLRVSLDIAEQMLASRLYYGHEGGLGVDQLAGAAGLTRDETFAAIDCYRAGA